MSGRVCGTRPPIHRSRGNYDNGHRGRASRYARSTSGSTAACCRSPTKRRVATSTRTASPGCSTRGRGGCRPPRSTQSPVASALRAGAGGGIAADEAQVVQLRLRASELGGLSWTVERAQATFRRSPVPFRLANTGASGLTPAPRASTTPAILRRERAWCLPWPSRNNALLRSACRGRAGRRRAFASRAATANAPKARSTALQRGSQLECREGHPRPIPCQRASRRLLASEQGGFFLLLVRFPSRLRRGNSSSRC
jgi:hypothetical protein